MRLLRSPASSDVSDASCVVLYSFGKQFDPADQPYHVLPMTLYPAPKFIAKYPVRVHPEARISPRGVAAFGW